MTPASGALRTFVAVLVALSMTAGIVGVAVLSARIAQADPGVVHLEPRDTAGPDPFVPSLLEPSPAGTDAAVPELAGTGDQHTCDPATLTAYLQSHPAAAAAWVEALDADPSLRWSGGGQVGIDQIADYVAELTPAVLGGDMQVTNHRFLDGHLAAVQSVLQEGTAVLVDTDGTPRVRCACGNPLTPMVESDSADADHYPDEADSSADPAGYVGDAWDGFDPADVADSHDPVDPAADDPDPDEPATSCAGGQYRDGDHCVTECPRGTHRTDHGRCRPDADPCAHPDRIRCQPPACPRPDATTATADQTPDRCQPQPCVTAADQRSAPTSATCSEPLPAQPCTAVAGTDCPPVPVLAAPVPGHTGPGTGRGAEGGADPVPGVTAPGDPALAPPGTTMPPVTVPPVGASVPVVPDPATTDPAPAAKVAAPPPVAVPKQVEPAVPPQAPVVAPEKAVVAPPVQATTTPPVRPAAVTCPDKSVMPATGCPVPPTGCPSGWALRVDACFPVARRRRRRAARQ